MRRYLLVVALIAALVSGIATVPSARAAAPSIFTIPIDESFSFDDCGFTIEGRTTGFIREHVFFDEEGNVVRVIDNFALKISYTNPETDETLTIPIAGPDIITLNADGSATVASIGIITRIVVPGEGLVAAQVGTIVLFFSDPEDVDPDVIFVAGPHEGDIFAALCDALAP
jgi:hypothetical protein